jgi:hypothetical protein
MINTKKVIVRSEMDNITKYLIEIDKKSTIYTLSLIYIHDITEILLKVA